VSNTTTETTIYTYAVPANTLSTNKILRGTVSGTYVNSSGSTKTMTFYVYYGGTAAANLIAQATSANIGSTAGTGSFTTTFNLIADNSASLQTGNISTTIRSGSTTIPVIFGSSGLQIGINSTSAQNLYVRVKHSAANANTTLVGELMHIELLNASDTLGSPTDASYLTLGLNGNLSAERILTAGTGISFADGGANSTLTINATNVGINKHLRCIVFNPNACYGIDTQVLLVPKLDAAITITNLEVSLDASANQVLGDVKYADTFIGLANAVVINDFDTTSGVRSDSTIATGDVAVGKCIYLQFDSQPNSAITQMTIDLTYDYQ
jgi:hypothetical protein